MNHLKKTPFALERYFAEYEFSAPHLLCCSDCEAVTLKEVLGLADAECSALWDSMSLGYTESQGLPRLRADVAALYDGVEDAGVIVGAPQELILLGLSALVDPGDHVICTWPGYQSLYETAVAVGAEVSRLDVTTLERGGGLSAAVAGLLQPNTKVVVINAPHNPTGWLPSPMEHAELIKLLDARGIYLFSDEMYAGLEVDPAAALPPAAAAYPRGVSLNGVSKTLSMPGARLGWLAAQDTDLIARVLGLRDYTTICSAAPSEIIGLIAVRNRAWLIERNMSIIRRNLELLDKFFAKHSRRLTWIRPKAGSICFPTVLGLRDGASVETMCRDLVDKKGVMLLPATVYGYADPDRPETQRFRLGLGRANLPECLRLFGEYLDSKPDVFA